MRSKVICYMCNEQEVSIFGKLCPTCFNAIDEYNAMCEECKNIYPIQECGQPFADKRILCYDCFTLLEEQQFKDTQEAIKTFEERIHEAFHLAEIAKQKKVKNL